TQMLLRRLINPNEFRQCSAGEEFDILEVQQNVMLRKLPDDLDHFLAKIAHHQRVEHRRRVNGPNDGIPATLPLHHGLTVRFHARPPFRRLLRLTPKQGSLYPIARSDTTAQKRKSRNAPAAPRAKKNGALERI